MNAPDATAPKPRGDATCYMIKLIPPRPTFSRDMDAAERAVMGQHVGYWREWMDRGNVLVYGPVMDPKGAFGLGVVRFESEAALRAFMDGDPSVLAGVNKMEHCPMLAVYPAR